MEILVKSFLIHQATQKSNTSRTTQRNPSINNKSIKYSQNSQSKFQTKKTSRLTRLKTIGQERPNKENDKMFQSSIRSLIAKNGVNIQDSYNYYNFCQKNLKPQGKTDFSFSKSSKKQQLDKRISKIQNSLKNSLKNSASFFKKQYNTLQTHNSQTLQNWRDSSITETYFWFQDKFNERKSPVKQILKYSDRQRKIFLQDLMKNRLTCEQIEIERQKQQQKPINYQIRQSKVQRINITPPSCNQIEQQKDQVFSNQQLQPLNSNQPKQHFRFSLDDSKSTMGVQKSLMSSITRLSNYNQNYTNKKSKKFLMNIMPNPINSPKYRISKAQKQNIDSIVRKSIVSFQSCSSSIKASKNTHKQTEFLRMSFNKKFKQLTKLKKKNSSIKDQSYHEQEFKNVQAFSATLQGENHEENQDSIEFSDSIYIVCDGHGSNGKKVSNFVSQSLHKFAKQKLIFGDNQINQNIIKQIFRLTQNQLDEAGLDITFSGTTAVMVIKDGLYLYCASVGDSRAILSTNSKTIAISVQHKPFCQKQKLRIQASGGVIRQTQVSHNKFSGPMRVWAPGKISWGPGLALSRAFGDKASRKYGVICQPQILTFKLTFDQDFMILGSDGLFDVMSDQQISSTVKKFIIDGEVEKHNICNQLIQMAKEKWKQDCDDISCILVLL